MPQVNEFSWINKFAGLNFLLVIMFVFLNFMFFPSISFSFKKLEKFNFLLLV